LKLVRPELVVELRAAVHRALDTNAPASVRGVALRSEGLRSLTRVEVLPIVEPETKGRCLVVLFIETDDEHAAPAVEQHAEPETPSESHLQDLERELSATKEYLQSTIEELETSNEELKSANEELKAANEEMENTNEELETSKEELQSTNEELTTVNDELHIRMQELSLSNDDLQNLLAVMELPVIMVGLDLRIRRFTLAAERLLHLTQADLGRPVAHLSALTSPGPFELAIREVIQHLTPRHEEIVIASGRRLRVGVAPYQTTDHAIKGAVLTFGEVSAPTAPS